MTKTEQREYLKKYVESQGTQVGLSIVPLLEDLITSNEEVFVISVEDNEEQVKKVTNPQTEIDNFISDLNKDPLHNVPKVYISGFVITFGHLEINETEVNGKTVIDSGEYNLTLTTTAGMSQLVYRDATREP